MKMASYDVVILSDLHLGSEVARANEALELLRSIRFRRLILLGDIFCDLNFRRLNEEHWQFLSHIRKISSSDQGAEVIWVEGNHDCGLTKVMSHLVGIPVYKEYIWESAGEMNLAIHGHQFDSFIIKNHALISGLANNLHLSIQKLSSKGQIVAQFIDRLNTQWQRLTPKVAKGALDYALLRGASRIFCGHTHQTTTLASKGVTYYNAGSWTNSRPSYITIQEREVMINEYFGRIDNYHTRKKRREIAAAPSDVAVETRLPADAEHESVYS
jgi:UDP-2,3-diacylglucosamine pyrophosphatase LpxH